MDNSLKGAGGKLGALAELRDLIQPVRKQVLDSLLIGGQSGVKRKRLLARVGELTLFRAEIDAHGRALQLADLACHHGKAGTEPGNWATYSTGEPYDAHQEILIALECAPGQGKGLSPALMSFFEQLPRERSADFAEGMNQAVAAAPILSLLPDNDYGAGLGEVTSDEIGGHAHDIARDLLEKTMFLESYNQDLAGALALAKEGGNFDEINQLIF